MPPWRIDFTVREGVGRLLPASELAYTAARALSAAGAPSPASIGLILSDDRELALLSERHMGQVGPTDVLSFPLLEMHQGRVVGADRLIGPPRQRLHLGDIVLSVERAAEQAEQGRGGHTGDVRWSPRDEMRLLVVHGVLHVCGWDHAVEQEEAEMRALERAILEEVAK